MSNHANVTQRADHPTSKPGPSNGEWHDLAIARYLAGEPQADIARLFGVSRERVRQIIHRAGIPNPRDLLCAVEDCPISARWPDSYCTAHLRAWALYGDPLAEAPPKPRHYNEHGHLECFRRGCRCEPCLATYRAFHRAQKEKRYTVGAAQPERIPHGTPSGYQNWGCRCDDCFQSYWGKQRTIAYRPSGHRGQMWRKLSS